MLYGLYRLAKRCRRLIPKPLQLLLGTAARYLLPRSFKTTVELNFWRSRWEKAGGTLDSSQFRSRMLEVAEEEDSGFLKDKIVADFGCGPLDTLGWAHQARIRIGIDILADEFSQFGIASHNMCYVCSTERSIPLPSNYVDVLFTLNAMDHVHSFKAICCEILRILAHRGEFIGSFNLDEPSTITEPQKLTEELVKRHLLKHLEVISYRLLPKSGDTNHRVVEGSPLPAVGSGCTLLVRAKKPS